LVEEPLALVAPNIQLPVPGHTHSS
jgi:hypothetical protein